ncbi:sigma-70 family RNA polymerase sigma factor [Aurantimonas sp. Leaf443]|uniref:sigma-70 family RNA polymerase sigma factor n=1 Tax=Aurantimonas sp. Leaf443 TaxID=1736378 RepID=UPI0006FB6A11|nr:sigma-70 family RNA polymerase sigma factor [Aurantimonas sp. Leaf443]KQT83163.1 RNA polymerase subunit sigma [Aurantimonas sp. Leaf443]
MKRETSDLDVLAELAPMRRYALSLTRDPAAAEDLVHDTLVRAIERREQYRPGRPMRVWLLSILHNRFVDGLRRRKADAARDAELGRLAPEIAPPAQEDALRLADLRRAFLTLPEEQRAALHLVTIEGLSYEDAARALAIPVGTLVSRLSRARARLRGIEEGAPSAAPAENVVPFTPSARTSGGFDGA